MRQDTGQVSRFGVQLLCDNDRGCRFSCVCEENDGCADGFDHACVDAVGINGSGPIVSYLIEKYRDLIPETFFPREALGQAKISQYC